MSTQHTPGPWHTNAAQDRPDEVRNGAGARIAACGVDPAIPPQVREANARLVAAAPGLRKAVVMLLAATTAEARYSQRGASEFAHQILAEVDR